MKRAISYFMILSMMIMSLIIPTEEYKAYEANLSVGVSASSIKIGDTVTVTVKVPGAVSGPVSLYFPTNIMEYVSTSTEASVVGGTIQFSIGKGGRAASDTVTVKLKAKTTGSASLKVEATGDIYDYDSLEEVVLKGTSTTVTVENQTTDTGNNNGGGGTTTEPQKSGDNSLSSLKLSSGTLSPNFKYSTTKYTATVGYDVSEVTISAKTSNEKAEIVSITGDGAPVKLNVGENTIKIVVKAENGQQATYTIVVTRKEKETTVTPQPSEDESQSGTETETTTPEVNEFLQYNGEQLTLVEKIPAERIPADFESQLLVVNGQQMQGLSFVKADLKVLYLNNTNNAGSLYVYDEAQQMIYPFIKLNSEKNYVMVLVPNEQEEPVPEGFESCTFSIEGKGEVKAYQLKEEVEETSTSWNPFAPETFYAAPAKANDFYLIYCMNNAGEKGWYMYDAVEETFMRYIATAPSAPVGGDVSDDTDLQDKYAALEKELKAAKMAQYIIIAVAAAIVLILTIVIIVLVVKNRRPEEDFFDGYEEDEEETSEENTENETTVEEVETEEVEAEEVEAEDVVVEEMDEVAVYAPHEEIIVDTMTDENDEDDEIEIEFYEMEPDEDDEIEIEFYEMEPEEDDEIEIEFFNMEELIVSETEATESEMPKEEPVKEEPVVKIAPVVEEIKIERRPKVEDPTSKLSSKKADDDDDLEFIDFE